MKPLSVALSHSLSFTQHKRDGAPRTAERDDVLAMGPEDDFGGPLERGMLTATAESNSAVPVV